MRNLLIAIMVVILVGMLVAVSLFAASTGNVESVTDPNSQVSGRGNKDNSVVIFVDKSNTDFNSTPATAFNWPAGELPKFQLAHEGSETLKVSVGMLNHSHPQCVNCGDADGNGLINITDCMLILGFVFNAAPVPPPCGVPPYIYCQADFNGDGNVNVSDVVACINYVFQGAPCPHCKGLPCWIK